MEYVYSSEEEQVTKLGTLIVPHLKKEMPITSDSEKFIKQEETNQKRKAVRSTEVESETDFTYRPNKPRLVGRPIVSDNPRNVRRRENEYEKKLVREATKLDLSLPINQKILMDASKSRAGQKYFPGFRSTIPPLENFDQVKKVFENSKELLQSSKSKLDTRGTRNKLTQGLSAKQISNVTGLSQRTGRRILATNRISGTDHSGPGASDTVQVVKSSRKNRTRGLCDLEIDIYRKWFEKKTEVRSGSATILRQVSSSKHEFLFDLFASFPSLLRHACTSPEGKTALDQARQSFHKTRFQIALVSSHPPQGVEINDDEEYSIRHEYVKNRYKESLKKKQKKAYHYKTTKKSSAVQDLTIKVFHLQSDIRRPLKKSIKLLVGKLSESDSIKQIDEKEIITMKKELAAKKVELRKVNCDIQKILIEPIGDVCFWNLIENTLKIHWTANVKPYNCNLCMTEGPGYEPKAEKLRSEKIALEQAKKSVIEEEEENTLLQRNSAKDLSDDSKSRLQKQMEGIKERRSEIDKSLTSVTEKLRKAAVDVKKYQIHLKQLQTCRPRVIEAAEHLTIRQCLVYRDFVNQHNVQGRKINNFVLVVLYRETEGGELLTFNLSNIIEFDKKGSCDAYFVADVFTFHLKSIANGGSGLFERFDTIIISGDHGPHFSSAETVYNESTFFPLYKKKIRVLSLCSYHAFNRCDAAGAAVKSLAYQKAKENLALISAEDYAYAVREDGQGNAWSYAFDTINRSSNVFDGNGITDFIPIVDGQKLKLSDMCELEYCFKDENGQDTYQEGIVLARPIIGEPVSNSPRLEFYVLNVNKESKVRGFCQKCSNQNQRPMYHVDSNCSSRGHISGGLFESLNLNAVPDPCRLVGIQFTKARKAVEKSSLGKFPCRFENCTFKFYDYAHLANKHMLGNEHRHEPEDKKKSKLYSKEEAEKINPKMQKVKKSSVKATKDSEIKMDNAAQFTHNSEENSDDDADETNVWTDRDNTIDRILRSHNPKIETQTVKLNYNDPVWRIREVLISGSQETKKESKVYENVMITVFKGLKVKPKSRRAGYNLVKYESYMNIDGSKEEEGDFDEDKNCLFQSEVEAKVHLRGLLTNLDPKREMKIVTEEVWNDLQNAEEDDRKKNEPNEYEQNRWKQLQANLEQQKILFGEDLTESLAEGKKIKKKRKNFENYQEPENRRKSERVRAIINNQASQEPFGNITDARQSDSQ